MPLINLQHAETFVDGLDHAEGVALGPDGKIYAGGENNYPIHLGFAASSFRNNAKFHRRKYGGSHPDDYESVGGAIL